MEGAVSSQKASADKPLTHANPVDCVFQTKKMNGNIWNLANNHSMDCKEDGMYSTLDVTRENDIFTIGAGLDKKSAQKPFVIDKEGDIGIVAVTYFRQNRVGEGVPGCFVAEDEKEVIRKIKEVKAKNRWCVVVSHVGQEFGQMPLPHIRRRYKKYLKPVAISGHIDTVHPVGMFGTPATVLPLQKGTKAAVFGKAQID